MRLPVAVLLATVVLVPPTSAATPPAPLPAAKTKPARAVVPKVTFKRTEDVLRWIQDYRLEPQPAALPQAVAAMRDLGPIAEADTSGVYVGFVAGVLGDNPAQAEDYVGRMFPMPPEDQGLIVRAIAYSGLPNWRELLGKMAERMPARKALVMSFIEGKEKLLTELPMDAGPAAVDTQWGYYFATGSYAPILRLMSALAWTREKSDLNKLTMGSMAAWTLASNASRDRTLLKFCKTELPHQPKDVQASLKEVIEAAETFETGKIRKDALAAIEQLKAKGPQKDTTWAWAATATSTAIAVGCVVAGATGHVEFGIPCIVTGAMSSAAGKLLGN